MGKKSYNSLRRARELSANDAPLASSLILTDNLKAVSSYFYIYDAPNITQAALVGPLRHMGEKAFREPSRLDHVLEDARAERDVLGALEKHPLRTFNPDEATIFVIPTPMTELLAYGCQWEECTWYDEVFDALLNHPIYKRTQGHNHVLISFNWLSFNKRMISFIPSLSRNYRRIENVTVANHYDPFGCLELTDQLGDSYDETEPGFWALYPEETPVTKSFSVGLGVGKTFEIQRPTYERFLASGNFLFYHTRGPEQPFAFGSNKYRMAPLNQAVIDVLPKSSIGFELDRIEWMRQFVDSKFCLVLRGDTPHSHALLRAVRAGCIPVMVSDSYEQYAGSFKSSIALQDYTFSLDEEEVLHDPAREISKLLDIPGDVIQAKLRNLTIAQSVLLPDHPESLFVEAFLVETTMVDEKLVPEVYTRVPFQAGTATTIISGKKYTYRYPSSSFASSPKEHYPILVTGVLSTASNRNRRHVIRGTWAKHYRDPMRVFFLVAGPWEDIEEEFIEHGDLLWLDMKEDPSLLTYKTETFFSAVDTHFKNYDYIFKTHDDSYVGVHELDDIIEKYHPDYWGLCHEEVSCTCPSVGGPKMRAQISHSLFLSLVSPEEDAPTRSLALGLCV